jgi:hypothetical protein
MILLTSLLVLLDDVLLDDVLLVEDVLASANKSWIENPVPVEDVLLVEDVPSPDNRISIVNPVLVEDVLLEDVPADGGGPGGGPPAPCGPPWPPGPPEKAFAKTFCSSVAWALVNVPLLTSLEIRLLILVLMEPGEGGWPFDDWLDDWLLDWPLVNAELMSVSAVDKALWSLELIVPADTSDCSSCCSLWSGEYALLDVAEIEVIVCPVCFDAATLGFYD